MIDPPARPLSLAAATLGRCAPEEAIATAARSGYDMLGLRPDPAWATTRDAAGVRRAVADAGLAVLDVEVVRIGTTPDADALWLLDYAAELGAAHLLVVSDVDDRSETVGRFAELCVRSEGSSVHPVLEFMRFTPVRDLHAALDVVAAAGHPRGGVLVDALHLARSGGEPSDVVAAASRVPYLQLCDAPARPPSGGSGALAGEARHHRLPPGMGALPLAALLAAVPGVPVSVEVPSDEGWSAHTPEEWARDALAAVAALVSRS